MVVFAELGLFDVLRAALVVATAGFLPGLFLYAAQRKNTGLAELFKNEFFETLCVALIVSMALLSFLSVLLTFTIGFSPAGIAVAEALFIVGSWKTWKKKSGS